MKTAGIIGGAGYIGSYVTRRFLEEGFKTKVSSTDIKNTDKYRHLLKLKNSDHLDIRQLDVRDIENLREFVKGCDIVIHGGTPFQLDVKDPKTELFDPTIKGTENFLQVIKETPSVKKVVIVASVAAFNTSFPMPVSGKPDDYLYTESDEPNLDEKGHPYAQAKYHADQAVRKFIKENPDPGFEIISVYPVTVMGPALSNREDSTSMGLQHLFKNKIAPNPFVQLLFDIDAEFAIVDVRDVAEGIYQSATEKGKHGDMYYLSNESWKISEISRLLNLEMPMGEPRFVYSGKQAEQNLGVTFRPAADSFKAYAG